MEIAKLRSLFGLSCRVAHFLKNLVMRGALSASCVCIALLCLAPACSHFGHGLHQGMNVPLGAVLPNPLPVPVMDREYLWLQIVDTVDDYFKIAREERMRSDGGVVTDGRIHTHPEIGATYLEPWRKDSTPGFEKLHATLQSVRRYATVNVSPGGNGYDVEIIVYKELEDVAQPEHAAVGATLLRHDGLLVSNESNVVGGPATLAWIPLGRDALLEQRMLAELQGRLAEVPIMNRLPSLEY